MSTLWGRDDLTCPLAGARVLQMLRDAHSRPWRGDTSVTDRRHIADTTAITEPGRLTRVMLTFDFDYHGSGWFANSDYDRCLHLSISHPRPDRTVVRAVPKHLGDGRYRGMDLETPTDDEARAWGLVFFRQYAQWAWFEPAVGPGDPYRAPNVVHLRLSTTSRPGGRSCRADRCTTCGPGRTAAHPARSSTAGSAVTFDEPRRRAGGAGRTAV